MNTKQKLSFLDILAIIAKQIKLIIVVPFITCVIMIIYVLFIAKPVFVSSAKIMSSSGGKESVISGASGIAAQFGINLSGGDDDNSWLYPEIVKSRSMAKTLMMKKYDTKKFGEQKTLLEILTNQGKKIDKITDEQQLMGIQSIVDMVKIQNFRSIFTLSVFGSDPKLVKEIADDIIVELDNYQRSQNKEKAFKTRKFIERRIESTQKELETAEDRLRDFVNSNRRIQNSPSLQLEKQRLDREVLVLNGVFTTLKQQLEQSKIDEVRDTEYVIIIDPPEIPLSRKTPHRSVMVFYAGIFGILLGIFIGLIRNYFQNVTSLERNQIADIKNTLLETMKITKRAV